MHGLQATVRWPTSLVEAVRGVRTACQWCTHHTLLWMPLDWPIRFVFVAGLYCILRRWWSARASAGATLAALLGKELFDVVAHQNVFNPRAPDWGDAADVLSGLAGLGAAHWLWRARTRRRTEQALVVGEGGSACGRS